MKAIPATMRAKMALDPFMKRCCVPGCTRTPIEWNHAIIYARNQVNQPYAIVPLCKYHHRGNSGTITVEGKLWSERFAIERSKGQIKYDCPRVNWEQRHKEILYLLGEIKEEKKQVSEPIAIL